MPELTTIVKYPVTQLSFEQIDLLAELALLQLPAEEVVPALLRLSAEWKVEWREVVHAWGNLRTLRPEKHLRTHRPRVPLDMRPEWKDQSPVAYVQETPGALPVLPRNWVLIAARVRLGIKIKDLAWQCGVTSRDYIAMEEARLNPTEIQAARICARLELNPRETFIASALPPMPARAVLQSFSYLAILRSQRRLSVPDLTRAGYRATGVAISYNTVKMIEKGEYVRDLSRDPEVLALAKFFGVTPPAIKARLTEAVFKQAVHNTRLLHETMRVALESLPSLVAPMAGEDTGPLLIDAGGKVLPPGEIIEHRED